MRLEDFMLVERAVAVTYGPRTFGVVAYPERVSAYRFGLFHQDASKRGVGAALAGLLKGLVAAWAVTEGGAPAGVTTDVILRLSPGARRSIFKAIVDESRRSRPDGQTEEERDEVMRMSIELSNLQENLYDTARVPVVFKDGDSVEADELTIEHRAIDLECYDELQAMGNDESDAPLSARQLARLDARIKDLTDNGSAVASFPVEFWAGLKPALRENIIAAVTENVPRDVLAALAARMVGKPASNSAAAGGAHGGDAAARDEGQPQESEGALLVGERGPELVQFTSEGESDVERQGESQEKPVADGDADTGGGQQG